MIHLVVNNYTMDLPPGLTLERELETSIFRRNSEAHDFTYPVDLPLTQTNIKALGHPELIAKSSHQRSYDCEITIDGIYAKAVLYIESVSHASQAVRVSISGDYGGFWRDAAKIKVNELELGGIRTVGTINTGATASEFIDPSTTKCELFYTPCTTADHINDIINGVITDSDYLFYPAVDEAQNLTKIHEKQKYQDESADGVIPDIRSIINPYFYNNSGDKGIIDPVKAYIETTFQSASLVTHDRYFWVPFFRLIFIIRKCFEDLGYSVAGEVFEDDNFSVVTLFNTYAINRCTVTETDTGTDTFKIEVTHAATTIDPRNHVPKWSVTDFLKEVAKPFNLQYKLDYTNREVTIDYIEGLIHGLSGIIDISKDVNPKPEIVFEIASTQGIELSWVRDENNGASLEKGVDNLDGLTQRGAVGYYNALSGISTPLDLELAYVQCENAWYQYEASSSRWYFFGFETRNYKSVEDEGVYSVESKAVPVSMARFNAVARITFPNGTFLSAPTVTHESDLLMPYAKIGMEGRDLLAIQRFPNAGIGGDAKDAYEGAFTLVTATVPPIAPTLCNYLGVVYPTQSASALTHPCGSNTIYDAKGNIRQGIKLVWNDYLKDGLYKDYWKSINDLIEGAVVADYEILMDSDFYKDFDPQSTIVKVDGVLFLCDKVNYRFPFPSTGKIRLVRFG